MNALFRPSHTNQIAPEFIPSLDDTPQGLFFIEAYEGVTISEDFLLSVEG